MTRLSVWPVRTALLYLGAGFLIGALMLFEKGARIDPSWLRLLPLHVEFVLIGWAMQLAMGVAFWILPRFSRGAAHGNQTLGWTAYGLLNIGVISVGVGLWLNVPPIIPVLGRLAQLLAALSFMLHAWPRIRPVGV